MSRPRFLVDQDFKEQIVKGARRLEPAMEFLMVREIGLAQASDAEILSYAAAGGWLVLSHDFNTMTATANEFMAAGKPMNGLVVAHQRSAIAAVIDSLVLIWSASEAEEYVNRIQYLPM
jgi:predicted nuclease of predicted toxin-antitoxin system